MVMVTLPQINVGHIVAFSADPYKIHGSPTHIYDLEITTGILHNLLLLDSSEFTLNAQDILDDVGPRRISGPQTRAHTVEIDKK